MTSSGPSEAGYIALSDVVKEIVFLRQVQDFMESSMRISVQSTCSRIPKRP